MKFKLFIAISLFFGFMSSAHATKVAEFGDPVIGNSYAGCTFTKTYGTGGGGYLYDEYQITCPTGGPYKVGVYYNTQQYPYQCTFYPGNSSYYVQGNCTNWRVYLY